MSLSIPFEHALTSSSCFGAPGKPIEHLYYILYLVLYSVTQVSSQGDPAGAPQHNYWQRELAFSNACPQSTHESYQRQFEYAGCYNLCGGVLFFC